MTEVHVSQVPDDAVVFTGPRGGDYFFRNERKVYIYYRPKVRQRDTRFKPRQGAFHRFTNNQSSIS